MNTLDEIFLVEKNKINSLNRRYPKDFFQWQVKVEDAVKLRACIHACGGERGTRGSARSGSPAPVARIKVISSISKKKKSPIVWKAPVINKVS